MQIDERKVRHEKWQTIIDEQEASGLSQTQFCKERSISSAQLGYYRSILKPKQAIGIGSFASVAVNRPLVEKDVRVILPNGFQCTFPSNLNSSAVKEFCAMLHRIRECKTEND